MPFICAPKRQNQGPSEMAPPAKRYGLPIRQYEVTKTELYKGIKKLPSDTLCARVTKNDFHIQRERTEMTDEEVIEVLVSQDTMDSKALEAPYAPFFEEYSDEEFIKGIGLALKVKQQMDMEEEAREKAEERQRMLEAIAEYEEKRKELLKSMVVSDKEECSEDEESGVEDTDLDTDGSEDQDSESEDSGTDTESEAESEAQFEILEPEEQHDCEPEICEESVVFDGFFDVVCEEEVCTSD